MLLLSHPLQHKRMCDAHFLILILQKVNFRFISNIIFVTPSFFFMKEKNSIVWARLDYGSVKPIHTLMGLAIGSYHGPTALSVMYKFDFRKPLIISAREFQREFWFWMEFSSAQKLCLHVSFFFFFFSFYCVLFLKLYLTFFPMILSLVRLCKSELTLHGSFAICSVMCVTWICDYS